MKKNKSKKTRKYKKRNILILILLLALVGAAFYFVSSRGDESESKPKDTPKQNKPVETVKIVDVNSKSRPYAVMINNIGAARKLQSGLQDAYIIYEIIVEGGITRYMALFLDADTERIGSIRSSRHYYLDYALENDAIYVHHGQSVYAKNDFSKLGIDRIVVDNSKTGWRDKTLKGVSSEHTLFTSIEKINNGLGKKRATRNKDLLLDYSVKSLDFASMEGAIPANNVSIKYSNSVTSSYEYDDANKVYKRSVNDTAHTDYVTKEQYTFKNIITYQIDNNTISGDNKGRQDIKNIGSGEGYLISEGYAVPITWEKKSRSAQTIYKFKDGNEIKVNDGNTFIQIQPTGKKLVIE